MDLAFVLQNTINMNEVKASSSQHARVRSEPGTCKMYCMHFLTEMSHLPANGGGTRKPILQTGNRGFEEYNDLQKWDTKTAS